MKARWVATGALLGAAALASFYVSAAAVAVQTPGTRIKIEPASLAKPNDTPSKANGSRNIPRPGNAMPQVPPGFTVDIFAEGLASPRNLLVAPNGDVLVAEQGAGRITLLRDADGDYKAEVVSTFTSGFRIPFGLDFAKGALYVADSAGVWRIPYAPGDTKATGKEVMVTPEGAFGVGGGHSTRSLVFGSDENKFYVAIGSISNINEEPLPRATIQEFTLNAEGTRAGNQRTFATGLRNPVGTTFYPGTNDLYTVVNERDTMGDELVPDYLTRVADGGFYGWPYSYIGKNPQPGFADKRPDLVAKAIVPDVLFRSHSAPIGITFYDGDMFPAEYRGGAFVGLRGSWNAAQPRGYYVAYVPFKDKKPAGDYQVFASGFWTGEGATAEVWGRPSGVAVWKDGSLLIADEISKIVWRVTYKK